LAAKVPLLEGKLNDSRIFFKLEVTERTYWQKEHLAGTYAFVAFGAAVVPYRAFHHENDDVGVE
jgi:hypothetical protein